MLALLEAAKGEWAMMFLWLVVAFIVDGIDGPLARRYHVKKNAQVIDGVLLDLIIDYLTYVFIPAFRAVSVGSSAGLDGLGGDHSNHLHLGAVFRGFSDENRR